MIRILRSDTSLALLSNRPYTALKIAPQQGEPLTNTLPSPHQPFPLPRQPPKYHLTSLNITPVPKLPPTPRLRHPLVIDIPLRKRNSILETLGGEFRIHDFQPAGRGVVCELLGHFLNAEFQKAFGEGAWEEDGAEWVVGPGGAFHGAGSWEVGGGAGVDCEGHCG